MLTIRSLELSSIAINDDFNWNQTFTKYSYFRSISIFETLEFTLSDIVTLEKGRNWNWKPICRGSRKRGRKLCEPFITRNSLSLSLSLSHFHYISRFSFSLSHQSIGFSQFVPRFHLHPPSTPRWPMSTDAWIQVVSWVWCQSYDVTPDLIIKTRIAIFLLLLNCVFDLNGELIDFYWPTCQNEHCWIGREDEEEGRERIGRECREGEKQIDLN